MEQILKQLLEWATKIKNQNMIEGNSSTIVGSGLEKLINTLSDFDKNKADNKAIDELKGMIANATVNNKGVFETEAGLKLQYPQVTNLKGWYAFVGTANPRTKYIVNGNGAGWTNTGEKHHVVETELNEYVENKIIYNVSQIHKKYDYANNQTARNIIPAASRSLGQVVSYKLGTGKWVTEQYIGADVSGWAVVANWKYLGGLQAEDVHQLVDSTIDKPISPKGVLTWVESLGLVSYKETTVSTPIDFTNLINEDNVIKGTFINSTGVIENTNDFGHNPDYFAVKPSTTYYSNSRVSYAPNFIVYDADKKVINNVGGSSELTTHPRAAFVRYNVWYGHIWSPLYLYEKETSTTVISDTPVLDLGVNELNNATEVAVVNNSNVLPPDSLMSNGFFDSNHNIVTGGNWSHSDYFAVKGGTTYELNTKGLDSYVYNWYYDAEKRPVSTYTTGNKTSTSPSNARFARVSNNSPLLDGIYFREKSSLKGVVLPELYIPQKNILVDEVTSIVHSYTALGDSLTAPGDSYANILSKSLGVTEFRNLAISGMGSNYLLGAVDTIADGYSGLVTVMIGSNDTVGTPIGNTDEILNKKFADLVNGSSFAENYRLALETLMRKAPAATIIVMPSLSLNGKEVLIEKYRDATRKVCTYLAIPCSDVYRTCGISPPTYGIYTSDGLHPNSTGHAKIHKLLLPFVKKYL